MWGDHDPEGRRLPIKVDSATNGETYPIPLNERHKAANRHALDVAGESARAIGMGRRNFMMSACGAAATLLAFNDINKAYGQTGGSWKVPLDAGKDSSVAQELLKKKHFIFDVQTHHFGRDWGNRNRSWLSAFAQRKVTDADMGDPEIIKLLGWVSGPNYMKDVFLDSYTDVAVLTFVPSTEETMPLSHSEASETRDAVQALQSGKRLLLHGRINPTMERDVKNIGEIKEKWGVSAAKTYTQFLNSGLSFWLDDHRVMDRYVSELLRNDIRIICVHKGLPFPSEIATPDSKPYMSAKDVGPAARTYKDMAFVIYHSAFVPELAEGPYSDRGPADIGTNSLIRSMRQAGLGPGSNVYAEIGASWRYVMKDPNQAAHFIGKLLKYVGEDNVVWGTDSLFFGSPQDQILAFQTFHISEEYQERYGYPAITDEIRAKVFGLNSARLYGIVPSQVKALADPGALDPLRRLQNVYAERPNPSFQTYGPKTRSQFLRMAKEEAG
ncbi:hypothetical protein GCM10007897_40690 [Sphingobium jiangsuense]|uniref:Amidohydrolase-related domain-containing protein n=1 Tax=Sphingobium jiangsuense TaxID=870476 RepID=A0A7W6FT87_9SPHN|nr:MULTISPECIES: amidohydrolase family protein [Sphingobium]MBB3928859.1 hypothetical protein [Sphingobium jiangsuense]WRD78582.1 amidohydrolase family protein [Sphingobium baderi]GLT02650.1 hypothetical protein GCM10007897_40690 [Sphingobium jiangsuense]